jgi:hypothetical protein
MLSRLTQKISRILAASAFMIVAACSPKLDGTSWKSFQDSFNQITSKMTKEEVRQFDNDLTTLMKTKGLNLGQLREYVNGMTPSEIRAEAKSGDLALKRFRLEQVNSEITQLEQEDTKAAAQKEEVGKFALKVNKIRGEWTYDPSGYDKPESQTVNLSLTVSNDTAYTISGFSYDLNVSFDGVARGNDPWSYTFEKPLAPGKTVTVLINDKGDSDGAMYSMLSIRTTNVIIQAIKDKPDTAISATIALSSVTTDNGTHLDAAPPRNDFRLKELRAEQVELKANTTAG